VLFAGINPFPTQKLGGCINGLALIRLNVLLVLFLYCSSQPIVRDENEYTLFTLYTLKLRRSFERIVDLLGFEPRASALQRRRSSS
jgi:hypothetical protein